ncbi:MAG: hypothetical protein GEU98_15680 [Pseudonocardiaceae bacterium]|nr:hypothetical protein [Pseudonocardiaceae bacterium]
MESVQLVVLLIAPVIVLAAVAWRSVLVVRPDTSAVIERLGRFRAVLEPGLHLLVPFVDRIRARIDRREQVLEFTDLAITTADKRVASVRLTIRYEVSDPRAATYEVAGYPQAVAELTKTGVRNLVGGKTFEQARSSYHLIRHELDTFLRETVDSWGIRVSRVELTSIDQAVSNA